MITMKAVPFIELTTVGTDEVAGGPIRVNAKFVVGHCVQIVPHRDGNQVTTALIFPAGVSGIHVKDSYEEIAAKLEEALGDGQQDG